MVEPLVTMLAERSSPTVQAGTRFVCRMARQALSSVRGIEALQAGEPAQGLPKGFPTVETCTHAVAGTACGLTTRKHGNRGAEANLFGFEGISSLESRAAPTRVRKHPPQKTELPKVATSSNAIPLRETTAREETSSTPYEPRL